MPKGVLWRQHDIFMAAMGGRKVGTWESVQSYEGLTERLAESVPLRLLVLPPLMHGAAQWACFMLMAQGATLVFPDDTRRVDPDDVWSHGRAREGQHHDHRGRRHPAARCCSSSTRSTTTSRPSSPWATAARR